MLPSMTNAPTTAELLVQLAAEMKRKGVSTGDMAAHLGIADRTLRDRLAGRADFTVSQIIAAADYLGVTLTTLLSRAEAVAA